MSTRSMIGLLHPDGKISAVYCHNDGSWSANGRVLWEHWRSGKGIKKMVQLGALSTLGEIIGKKHDMNWRFGLSDELRPKWDAMSVEEQAGYLDTTGQPNFYVYERAGYNADPRSKMCRFYGRDRGESGDCIAAYHGSIEDAPWEEYAYLYDEANQRWLTADTVDEGMHGLKWHLLSDVMGFYEKMPDDEYGRRYLGRDELPEDFPTVELPEPILSDEDRVAHEAQEAVAMF